MIVNMTGKALVFPDGTELEPMVPPPAVEYNVMKVWSLYGAEVVHEGWDFVEPEPPWSDNREVFITTRPVAEAYWELYSVEWVYAAEGEEREGKLHVTRLIGYE